MTSRVGRIALKLRLPEGERAQIEAIRRTIERTILQEALDELERATHARLGDDTVVRVRRLAIRWKIDEADLGSIEMARELGRDLVASLIAQIEALPCSQRLRPDPAANIAVLSDPDHAIAVFLADRAEGRAAWYQDPHHDPAVTWAAVVAGGSARVAAVERWLERMERRLEVARWLETGTVSRRDSFEPTGERPSAPAGPRGTPVVQIAPRLHTAGHSSHELSHEDAADMTPGAPETRAAIATRMSSDEPVGIDAAASEPLIATTEHGGVWYLARLVEQLGLAEALWAAGVREGEFLAYVAACVLGGGTGDVAWRWFGGAFDREPVLDPIADWAADELSSKLERALAANQLAEPPEALIAAFTCSARDADLRAAAICERFACALCQLFCARLGVEADPERVRTELAIPARMALHGERLVVTVPIESIAIDVRRAGLDFDPGYLPWLGLEVELVFEERRQDGTVEALVRKR